MEERRDSQRSLRIADYRISRNRGYFGRVSGNPWGGRGESAARGGPVGLAEARDGQNRRSLRTSAAPGVSAGLRLRAARGVREADPVGDHRGSVGSERAGFLE